MTEALSVRNGYTVLLRITDEGGHGMLELCNSEESTERAILPWRSPDLSTRLSVTDMRRSSLTEPTVV